MVNWQYKHGFKYNDIFMATYSLSGDNVYNNDEMLLKLIVDPNPTHKPVLTIRYTTTPRPSEYITYDYTRSEWTVRIDTATLEIPKVWGCARYTIGQTAVYDNNLYLDSDVFDVIPKIIADFFCHLSAVVSEV